MTIELWWLFAFTIGYLALLFLVAWAADSGKLPQRVISNPIIYTLSLGVYATSWTYYGSVGLAHTSGFAFLTIYLGVTGAFLLGPYILRPLLRLCREHQLVSIADLMAFRYGGRGTGLLVTIFMLVGILPYISLQIRAVTESVSVLTRSPPPGLLAFSFSVLITIFAVLFGSHHLSQREKHHGLVVAIAFESAFKLFALLVAGIVVMTSVFSSPADFTRWSNEHPEAVSKLYEPMHTGGMWPTLLFLAFTAAFLLPRQYHMTFTENEKPKHLSTAYWLFPLYLLLLNLPIIPILFAGEHLGLSMQPDFYVLGIMQHLDSKALAILVFLGGVSAASAMMIVTTLALSYMVLNYVLLPASLSGNTPTDFYQRLTWNKRVVVSLIIAAGYGFYIVIELNEGLASLGLISFVAAAQLLPGVLGLLFWPRANRVGFLAGLTGGAVVWVLLLIWPLLNPSSTLLESLPAHSDIWTLATFCTLSVNSVLFIIGSLLSHPTLEEENAAQLALAQSSFGTSGQSVARSTVNYRYAMQTVLGTKVAEDELQRALDQTDLSMDETRPAELRLLHEQIERNLTGLIGPTLAREILRLKRNDLLSTTSSPSANAPDNRLLELRLETSRERMKGMTRQLDDLRRYLREVLYHLPLGVCSVDDEGKVYLWNSAMESLTGVPERNAQDRATDALPDPWRTVLHDFAQSNEEHRLRCKITQNDSVMSINLHKASIPNRAGLRAGAGQVILMEDRTHLDTLESELAHSERLASIGRLAAGVAHEIGNPLTGIASIAQNLQYELKEEPPEHNTTVVREHTGDILDQVNRINDIVRSLLTFSHAESISGTPHELVKLSEVIEEAVRLVKLAPQHRHNIELNVPEETYVNGDANHLAQIFLNLINNACDASPDESSVIVTCESTAEWHSISVTDSGDGINPSVREQIFEPFFTTKPVGSGTGLGLSMVYSLVTDHGGSVRIDEEYNSGTRMIVQLPVVKQDPQSAPVQ